MMALARRKLQGYPVGWVLHALPGPLPLADEAFALVVAGLVVEHVADLPALLKEAVRVLCPGGRLVVSALHPERTAAGQRARFIDPETGVRQPITTYHRSAAEYLAAGSAAGLALVSEQTLVVTAELAPVLPRASRYVGMPLGWVAGWDKANEG
jgi:ubiquinone/menaquinone biosynthesis C-methylase UbiE